MKIFLVLFLVHGSYSLCKKCFPPDFIWGVGTSSYQIEGAWNESGKGESMWDWFSHTHPEKILDGSNGDVAADSYHKWREDVDLVEELGVNFYRISLSWSRILPDGTTTNVNQQGVDYYTNIIKQLRQKNIEPVVTIYHWDLPITLHEQGGWTNPKIIEHFVNYASLCFTLFPQIRYWFTLNEPYIHCHHGYEKGFFAPGFNQSGVRIYMCYYTQLLAHAKAYRLYHDSFKSTLNGSVGITFNTFWYEGLTEGKEDQDAAERALQWELGVVAHPVIKGNWPEMVVQQVAQLSLEQGFNQSRLPTFTPDEVALINGTFDYIGINYYTTYYTSPLNATGVTYDVDRNVTYTADVAWTRGQSAWLYNVPAGLRKLLNWMKQQYGQIDIIITENGWSDEVGLMNDTTRIEYINAHLCNALRAKFQDGVNVLGYFYWSFLNSYEWSSGYTEAFGLVNVDFASVNKTRTPKESFYFYRKIVKSGCLDYCVFR